MENIESKEIKKELEDIKALLIVFLQGLEIDNEKIGKAIGMSPGRVSQLIDKIKYPRK